MGADPAEVEVLVGLDFGKGEHHATAVDMAGQTLLSRPVANDQATLEALSDAAAEHGTPALVIDQPGSIAALALAVARQCGVAVAYIPGLVMRRAADLYPGEAKTDPRDSYVLADTARVHRSRLAWLAVTDEVLEQLRVLSGYDDDLAADVVRVANRLRDTLTSLNPALERVVGNRMDHPAVRALLARYSTSTAISQAGRTRLVQLLTKHAPRMGQRLADDVLAAVASQTVTVPAEATLGRVVADLAGELDRLHARRDQLASELEEVFSAHPLGPVLATLPGVGPRTGAKILAEVGDATRFATGAQLAAFASMRSPASKAFYDRKRGEVKRHNAAVICLAPRRCDVVLAMLKTATHYDPTRTATPSETSALA